MWKQLIPAIVIVVVMLWIAVAIIGLSLRGELLNDEDFS